MRLQVIIPQVKPNEFKKPLTCPQEDCQGRHFEHHQEVNKPLKDTRYGAVTAHRYRCLRCNGTFRVYPLGVTRAQTSQRVKGLGVMLYLLGLSYGATSLALAALGVYIGKTSVYEEVIVCLVLHPNKRLMTMARLSLRRRGREAVSMKSCQAQ